MDAHQCANAGELQGVFQRERNVICHGYSNSLSGGGAVKGLDGDARQSTVSEGAIRVWHLYTDCVAEAKEG